MQYLRTKSLIVMARGLIALLSDEWSGLVQNANAIPAFARSTRFPATFVTCQVSRD